MFSSPTTPKNISMIILKNSLASPILIPSPTCWKKLPSDSFTNITIVPLYK
jgi:hypothetical protein